ncbi:unnamed protein product [Diabrotica balteata]|uniref:Uncharacterized protein n=1 Tax=Diabrotica balteata TaxID=107213 RepID=A0A9N9SNX3_DIABA|nr:unnamed protein product [Diabrotica balteata]
MCEKDIFIVRYTLLTLVTEQTSNSPGENISTEVNNETIIVKTKKYERKKDMCYYCETDVINFVRHLKRNHSCELEVQRILSKQKKSKERRELLSLLKKKGNFIKNSQECVKPVKQGLQPSQSFLPCSNCLGFYRSKFLYRHRKTCLGGQSSKHSQAEGQNFLLKNVKKIDQRLKDEVFPRMRPDKISLEAKNDFLICAFGARYLKIHREKHHINVTSRKMRELSRILIEFKKIKACTSNLFEALKPKFYDDLVEATKLVAKYDTDKDLFVSPTYALNIGTSLKQCCDIALHMISKNEPTIETANCESNLKTLINLFHSNWRFDISNRAGNDLNLKKFNKITIVPLASDLKLLKQHLVTEADKALQVLKIDSHNVAAYNTLLETIYCRVILLNRKRPGELQRMLLDTYVKSEKKNESYKEFKEVVSETEKILLKNMKRIVIREILKVRSNFVKDDNPYLFGRSSHSTPICGYKIIAKYAVACGAKNPQAITCTRLRKHLATLTQLFNLSDNEIEQLSSFMGHTAAVHKNSYRLPDDVYQTAKISKLLILMENGEAGGQKGKTLDDISINLDQNLLEDESSEESDDLEKNDFDDFKKVNVTEELKEDETIETFAPKKKRILTPWTIEQKNIVKAYFSKYIDQKRAPKRFECEELKSLHPQLFLNKNWLKIKVFVQNQYLKKGT